MVETILVTGGAGFVGSHTIVELLNDGKDIVVVDNLVNAVPGNTKPASLERVEKLTGRTIHFHNVSLLDPAALNIVFKQYKVSSVIHFAALKAVGESTRNPVDYYKNNITGTINLIEAMRSHGVRSLIFSSSATVYGSPDASLLPVTEECPTGTSVTNPYGRTKYFVEQILMDLCVAEQDWSVVLLRYFNPVGAHESGDIGEDPHGEPNNLMPYVSQVAVGRRPFLSIFGSDYPTRDGTGERDYIHVVDLARGHLAALPKAAQPGCHIYNLGTGASYTVLEMVEAFRKASGSPIPVQMAPRRPGDVASLYANCGKAQRQLGWKAHLGLDDMCRDAWRWQQKNKFGYGPAPENGSNS